MALFRKNRATKSRLGYGHVFSQGLLLCGLLVINGFIVRSTVNLDWGEEVRITQAIQTVLPITMIVVELWIFDIVFAPNTKQKT